MSDELQYCWRCGGKHSYSPDACIRQKPSELASSAGSAAPLQTGDSQKRDWLRLVIMVENTEANRKIAGLLIAEGRRLAERFEGKKIVKGEALQVFGMDVSKEKSSKGEAQPNYLITRKTSLLS